MEAELRGRIVTPEGVLEGGRVVIRGETITSVEPAGDGRVDPDLPWIFPGLVSLHVHGGMGVDFSDPVPAAAKQIATYLDSQGLTGHLATLVSMPLETMRERVTWIKDCWEELGGDASGILGVHYEGPFLNSSRRGLHAEEALIPADAASLERLLEPIAGTGLRPWITLAVELEGAPGLMEACRARGVRMSQGHSLATAEQAARGIEAGARHATHLFNAMGPLHHREPGIVGAFLDSTEATVEIIPDLVHLHPAVVRMVIRQMGPARTALVTDALAPAGLGDGTHRWCGMDFVVRDGKARRADDGAIASVLDTPRMLHNLVDILGFPVTDVARMASTTPARALGLDDRGEIRPGQRADLAVLGPDWEVRATLRGGRTVYQRGVE